MRIINKLRFFLQQLLNRTWKLDTYPKIQSTTNELLSHRETFRGSLILFSEVAIDKRGFNGPYVDSARQKGFVSYGTSHVMRLLGSAEEAEVLMVPQVKRAHVHSSRGEVSLRNHPWESKNERRRNLDSRLFRASYH